MYTEFSEAQRGFNERFYPPEKNVSLIIFAGRLSRMGPNWARTKRFCFDLGDQGQSFVNEVESTGKKVVTGVI